MRHTISPRGRQLACMVAGLTLAATAWAQTPSQTPKVDNRAPGTAASDVAPGARTSGVQKDGRRAHGSAPAMNQGASSAQTYDYPASAPKVAPAKRP